MKAQSPCYPAVLLWLSIACGWGQGAPQFRAGSPQLLPMALPENPLFPAAVSQIQRPGGGFAFRTGAALPIKLPPLSPQPVLTSPDRSAGKPAETVSRAEVVQRASEIPLPFLRRADRNLTPAIDASPFTLRTTSEDEFAAQISLGVQTAVWHNDNFGNVPNDRAISEKVMEIRPILRLNLGSPPGPRAEKSSDSEAYAQVLYIPTVHILVDDAISRTLHRVVAEIGRANPIVLTAVRFEHDENVFGAQGDNSVEDSYTSSELSPMIAYNLSAKTSLRAQGFYRRITLDNPISNRTEYALDGGVDVAISVKTSVGLGSQIGEIRFDADGFGAQHFQQVYLSGSWKPTAKLSFQTRAGVELRQFEGTPAKKERVSPVIAAVLNYVPDTATRINVGVRVHNDPSISTTGALLQEVRLGADVRHEFGSNLYVRGEAAEIWRDYDTKLQQRETIVRPAIGYHTESGRIFDNLNVELFYQYRLLHSNAPDSSYDRNIFGIETTIFF